MGQTDSFFSNTISKIYFFSYKIEVSNNSHGYKWRLNGNNNLEKYLKRIFLKFYFFFKSLSSQTYNILNIYLFQSLSPYHVRVGQDTEWVDYYSGRSTCPLCPMVNRRQTNFKMHLRRSHLKQKVESGG